MPLLFLIFFLLEIFMLVAIGGEIGALATVAWVIVSAMIGVSMMQQGGRNALLGAQQPPVAGEDPALAQVRRFANSTILMFGGILLLIPGFLTDFIGLLSLIPPVRGQMVKSWTHSRHWQVYATQRGYKEDDVVRVIEGEYRRMDE